MLKTLAVANYRSLRELVVPLGALNVVTGANGSGKSSLYRALRLLAEAARGGIVAALAREGGLSSALWAGPETLSRAMKRGDVPVQGGPRKDVVQLRLGFATEDVGYCIDLGLPTPSSSAFARDPVLKRECIFAGTAFRDASLLVDRHGAIVRLRDGKSWRVASEGIATYDSMLTELADPERAPEVLSLRERIRAWRFYDHFRCDAGSPARLTQVGTRTPVLSGDGHDLAAAWQTIVEIGDAEALAAAVDDAFPGSRVRVDAVDGRFTLLMQQRGLLRELDTTELSDGTLRYLLWIAALHTPRPPPLMVLNEPETSLHPDLLPALGRLIASAASRSQVWVVSHASRLVAALEADAACHSLVLDKELGETAVRGLSVMDAPAWRWPAR